MTPQSCLRCSSYLRFMNMQRRDELPLLIGPWRARPPTRPAWPGPSSRATRPLASRAASLAAFPDLPKVRLALPGPRDPRRALGAAGNRGRWATEGPDVAFHLSNKYAEDNLPRGFWRRRLRVEVFTEVSKDLQLFRASVADETNLGYKRELQPEGCYSRMPTQHTDHLYTRRAEGILTTGRRKRATALEQGRLHGKQAGFLPPSTWDCTGNQIPKKYFLQVDQLFILIPHSVLKETKRYREWEEPGVQ
ncbi:uncharacterized protein LOC118991277 isoform X2 [Sturnira hondurensis]|uniref:uncharacterized protein LOC118991277 isoform X2 n=1 Tax=Sturnira hondurensis TaxID=192404 RepID=UPI0018795924|nr:uncharacterized protein LOC118991277 isoform X2 [Sturnira hondurensis]